MINSQLIEDLKEEGFNTDSLRALYLVPLIDTAWADGKIQNEEKAEITLMMEKRGIQKGSTAHELLTGWLSKKPADEIWQKAKLAVEPLFQELKAARHGDTHWIVEAAERVAKATGSGTDHISSEEKAVLQKISKRL